jgi:hypothetical protein
LHDLLLLSSERGKVGQGRGDRGGVFLVGGWRRGLSLAILGRFRAFMGRRVSKSIIQLRKRVAYSLA